MAVGQLESGYEPYGNDDSDTANGILDNTALTDYTVTLSGNLNMYGVGDTDNGDAYNVNNDLRILQRSTVTGDIAMGEYYRDTWTNSNTMTVDDGAVVQNADVTLIGAGNLVNFFGTGGSTAQTFSLYGLSNVVNVGGMNTDDVWDNATDTWINDYTSYGAVIGNIVSDNLFDSDDDQFAAQDYLNGMLRTAADYADLQANILGSKVDGDIIAYGTTTVGNVTGANTVLVTSVTDYAAEVTGNIELTSNDQNVVAVAGVVGARAVVGGDIVVTTDEGLTVNNVNTVVVGLATVGDITTTIVEDVVGATNANQVNLGTTGGAVGDTIVGDVTMSAAGVATNTLTATTLTGAVTPLFPADDARRADTIGAVSQTSVSGTNTVNVLGQGIVEANAPSVDGSNIVTADNNVLAPTTTVGDITQTSASGANFILLLDAVAEDIAMSTSGNNSLSVIGSKIYAVGQNAADAPQKFVTGIVGDVTMTTTGGTNIVTMTNAQFASLAMNAATNALTVNAGSEITGALSFDDAVIGLVTTANTANTITVNGGVVGSIDSKADANDAITIISGTVGAVSFGGGTDTIAINGGTVGSLSNTGILTIDNNVADLDLTASTLVLGGANDIGAANDLTGTGSITLVEGMSLAANAVTGFTGIVLDYTLGGAGINLVDSNVTDWDDLAELDNLDVVMNSADLLAGGTANLITANQNFTGTTAIDLTVNYGVGQSQTISLAWSAADNAYVSATAIDGKLWKITGKDSNTLTLAASVAP